MDEIIIEKIEKEIEAELAKENITSDMFGYVVAFENRKKKVLKDKYGIEYETIEEKSYGCSVD